MQAKVLLVLVAVTLVYVILGGVAFHYLEKSEEQESVRKTVQFQSSFLKNYSCVTEADLKLLIEVVIDAYSHGIITPNASDSEPNWNLGNSIFFASTVVTTIGYGHLSPATVAGKAVCVVYALIGIPIVLVLLSGIGQKLIGLYDRITAKCRHKRPSKLGQFIRFFNIFGLGCVFLVFIPSGIFCAMEDWSYGTSLYYSMITLSTIGFGDYIIGNGFDSWPSRDIYRLAVGVWIIVGLSWFATCISAAQDFLQHKVDVIDEKDKEKGDENSISEGVTKM